MDAKLISGRCGEIIEALEARRSKEYAAEILKVAEKCVKKSHSIVDDPLFRLTFLIDRNGAKKFHGKIMSEWLTIFTANVVVDNPEIEPLLFIKDISMVLVAWGLDNDKRRRQS